MKPELVTVPIGSLLPHPRNPRRHSEDQVNRLMESLRLDGQTKPVLARRLNSMLIAGHGVTLAAERLGWTEIQAILLDVDQATADRMLLADNRLAELSTDDAELVADLLRDVRLEDRFATGFTEAEAAKLFGALGDTLEIREIATGPVRDDFWIAIQGPLSRQAEVLDRVRVLLAEYPDVVVDLGLVQRGDAS
jgi:ParB-like chromosome segregation protein Spo0J